MDHERGQGRLQGKLDVPLTMDRPLPQLCLQLWMKYGTHGEGEGDHDGHDHDPAYDPATHFQAMYLRNFFERF